MEQTMKALSKNWWLFIVRGVVAILFGILIVAWPIAGILTLAILFGIYVLADGIVSLMLASTHKDRRGWLIFWGITGIAAGVVALAWPAITAVVLFFIVAAWAFLTGIAQLVFAFTAPIRTGNRLLLALGGVFSIVFGFFLVARPDAGALALAWLIGFFAVMFGIYHIAFGVGLKDLKNKIQATQE